MRTVSIILVACLALAAGASTAFAAPLTQFPAEFEGYYVNTLKDIKMIKGQAVCDADKTGVNILDRKGYYYVFSAKTREETSDLFGYAPVKLQRVGDVLTGTVVSIDDQSTSTIRMERVENGRRLDLRVTAQDGTRGKLEKNYRCDVYSRMRLGDDWIGPAPAKKK